MLRGSWLGIGGAVAVLAAAALIYGLGARGSSQAIPPDPPVPVTAATAMREDVPAIEEALGTVAPVETVSVQARVSGQIMQVYFKQGQDVTANAPLFLIDPRPYQAALDQAQGQLAHDQAVLQEATADLARYQRLAKENAIAQQQTQDQAFVVQQDQGTVKLDQANVETAALNLQYCHIAAPASGMTGPLLVDPGNDVTAGAGTTLVTISQMHPIYVSFSVPQDVLGEVRANQARGALETDAYTQAGQKVASGELSLVSNAVNTTTGTVMLESTFPNTDEALWPGEAVNVRLILYLRKNAVTVPQTTVMAGPNGPYVYVIGSNDIVQRVSVTVAATEDGIAVIAKGLHGGERVVTDGQYRLDNNVKVAIHAAPAGKGVPPGGSGGSSGGSG